MDELVCKDNRMFVGLVKDKLTGRAIKAAVISSVSAEHALVLLNQWKVNCDPLDTWDIVRICRVNSNYII